MLSALLILKPGVVLLPFQMVDAAWLLAGFLFNEETGACWSEEVGGVLFFAAIFGRCTIR